MPRVFFFIIIAASFFPAPASAEPEQLEGLSGKDIEKLEKGELVVVIEAEDHKPGRIIHAAFLIEQPIEKCWGLLRQPERQDEFTSGLKECELVGEGPDNKVVRFLVKVLFLKVRHQINHIFNDEIYRVDISLDPEYENDLTVFDATWRLFPTEAGLTLARYSCNVRLASWIPTLIQRVLTRLSIPSALEGWKKWLDSGGTWRK